MTETDCKHRFIKIVYVHLSLLTLLHIGVILLLIYAVWVRVYCYSSLYLRHYFSLITTNRCVSAALPKQSL